MTKSGIGTLQHPTMSTNTTTNTPSTPGASQSHTPTPPVSSSALIANAEIPIWVSDKKKWVTGISKKTTINDLIFAILKQCQIAPQSKAQLHNEADPLSSQYVLVEYNFEPTINNNHTLQDAHEQQVILTSQRILNGDSKVYKFLAKWSFSGQHPVQQQNNLMLKILQKQVYEENVDPGTPAPTTTTSISFNTPNELHKNTSLATKLLKKFGVSSSASSGVLSHQITKSTSSNLPASNPIPAYRYVDVKLPTPSSASSQQNKSFNQISPVSTTSSSSITKQQQQQPHRNFDPNVQKSFVTNSILEKDNKLKQQIKRFQLIDELIKETEKKSKSVSSTSGLFEPNVTNPTYNYSPMNTAPAVEVTNVCDTNKQLNVVDLNDVYCHFPEMSTHHLKEVEDFTVMCSQLFQLEEAIKNQKQILSALESDLQRELQPNQVNFLAENNSNVANAPTNNAETATPETEELRKEVNYSREQTRLQCKQLHDLDMCMKQNEQSLMSKEQELQHLLEELYIQEIYADNALESAITSTVNRPTTPSGQQHLNMSTFKLNSSSSPSSINNVMNGGNSRNNSVVNLQQESMLNVTAGGLANETVDSFENENNCTQDRVELMINERNSFNSSNIDFIQIQQQKRIAMDNSVPFESQTKRQIRLFNETNAAEETRPQSLKIMNQMAHQYATNDSGQSQQHYYHQQQQQLHSQQKSLSYGNLSGQQTNSTHNLYTTSPANSPQNNTSSSSLKRSQIPAAKGTYNQEHDHNQGHALTANMKNLKLAQNHQFMNSQSNGSGTSNNSNSNGDHSGGDNDSGISSMSSETAAAMTSALNSTLAAQNSFSYNQKPIIMGQQQRHQMFNSNSQQLQYNGQQYFSTNRQIYQTNGHSASSANISIHAQSNSNVGTNSKAVLETLV